ncbi:MAG: transglutaminase family protein [Mycobacteriales bacterium]|nr:transglutaminase family protein [Mycobacteriales bacterium]
MDRYLRPTRLLDHQHPALRALAERRGWARLDPAERVGAIYGFVRDDIAFGYNASDDIPASQVLADGLGQCNTKTTLLMALLRGAGVPVRFHGATIHKRLQKGVVTGLMYRLAPRDIIHSWAEVQVDGRWVGLEGVILDDRYLDGVRASNPTAAGEFLGYAVGTDNLASPPVEWTGADTYIQATGINNDFGAYDDPDAFYAEHGTNLRGLRGWVFRHRVRPAMNRKVAAVRACALTAADAAGCATSPAAR